MRVSQQLALRPSPDFELAAEEAASALNWLASA